MNTVNKKSTQIFYGILTGIGLWVFGHLLSGKLSFVEDIDLYNTGILVFLFPYIFALCCILVAKYSVKSKNLIYFKTSLICFTLPAFCAAVTFLLGFIMELKIPVISSIADISQLIFILPVVPALSIFYKMLELFGTETDGIKLVLLIALNLLPIIIGLIFSIKIYYDNCDK